MLNKYTVEFTLKYHKNRHISDATLNEFLAKAKARSKEFREHQNPIGYTNNRQNGFVHFYSNADFLAIYRIAENFANDKRFGFAVKQIRYTEQVMGKGGAVMSKGIMNLLMQRVGLKDFFTK